MTDIVPENAEESARWVLIRDAAVLQVKLIVDGIRDFLLVPASIVAAIMSLTSGSGDKPGPQFYNLIRMGKRSEEWIDLFGALRNGPEPPPGDDRFANMSIDEIVGKVERFVVEEAKSGGMTAQARERIDQALDAIQRRHASRAGNSDTDDTGR